MSVTMIGVDWEKVARILADNPEKEASISHGSSGIIVTLQTEGRYVDPTVRPTLTGTPFMYLTSEGVTSDPIPVDARFDPSKENWPTRMPHELIVMMEAGFDPVVTVDLAAPPVPGTHPEWGAWA